MHKLKKLSNLHYFDFQCIFAILFFSSVIITFIAIYRCYNAVNSNIFKVTSCPNDLLLQIKIWLCSKNKKWSYESNYKRSIRGAGNIQSYLIRTPKKVCIGTKFSSSFFVLMNEIRRSLRFRLVPIML